MPEEFDVVVAGGGPAGTVVSLCLARRGWRVAVLEATAFDRERYGETLPPEINPVLRELGLWDAFQLLSPLQAPGIISVWGDPVPYELDFVRNAHGPGWHIDRNRFDAMLCAEAAKAGARVLLNCKVTACARESGGWNLGGVYARVLVDATGRNGLRLEGEVSRENDDVLLAVALRIGFSEHAVPDLRTCIESTPSGWWYTSPLPDGDAMSMFFTDREVYTREGISVSGELSHAPLTERRVRSGRIVSSKVVYAPSMCRTPMCGEGWIAVGDSASSYDPLSGRGIFKALRQGDSAARAIDARLRGDEHAIGRYADQVRSEFTHYVRQRRFHYSSERRWADRPFWQSRVGVGL
jgi:flavin-dependent dehydrogenase